MNAAEFEATSNYLVEILHKIPLHWYKKQNDEWDRLLKIYSIKTIDELEHGLSDMEPDQKNYFRRRWFLYMCSKCDEYLFYSLDGNAPNPNGMDKRYDVKFSDGTCFDIKSSVIPAHLRKKASEEIDDPREMVNYFYENQSTGVRESYNNRLFIVHHSFRTPDNEMELRCDWKLKKEIFKTFSKSIDSVGRIDYTDSLGNHHCAAVIFVLEDLDGRRYGHIFGL